METRKAQLTGGSTFTVSLPKDWVGEVDLETGETLRLYERGRTLIVEPAVDDEAFWTAEVDVAHRPEAEARRAIQALYTTGYERIHLSIAPSESASRRAISATARELIGLETLAATESQITLQTLLDSATVSVDQSANQLLQVTLSMHEDAVATLLERDTERAEHVTERDDQVDRLYAMISRHFQRSLVSFQETEQLDQDQADLYDYQTTARQLERVADHAEKIATLGPRFDGPIPDDLVTAIETHAAASRRIVDQAASAILDDADVETAHAALDDRDELTAELEALERELHERDVADSHLIALVIDSVARTAEYGGNIAETALQTAARAKRH